MNSDSIKQTAIAALEDIKARDIVVMHVAKLTSIADYMIVASGDSARQTKALARNVMEKIKEAGGEVYGVEGEENGEWVLVDLGGVIVHIMHPAVREYYNLEELWGASPARSRKSAGSAQ
jgi:ribosome-associated protein